MVYSTECLGHLQFKKKQTEVIQTIKQLEYFDLMIHNEKYLNLQLIVETPTENSPNIYKYHYNLLELLNII